MKTRTEILKMIKTFLNDFLDLVLFPFVAYKPLLVIQC